MGTAILLGHHQILRHVDQTTRQVTRVGGLQCRIRETLTSTVGGDEVLQHVETFAEVGRDRRLNDGAVRLGHQAAHTRHLANLSCRAARAGVGHHVDGVERFLLHLVAMAVDHRLTRELRHHGLGDLVASLAPDVHHLVVALARGHQTRGVLLGDFLDLFFSALNDARLLGRHQHVVDADRDAGLGGQTETVLQQLVGKDHGLFETALAERHVDELGNFLLLERLVDVGKRQALGQDFRQQGTPGRGFPQRGRWHEFTGLLVLGVLGQTHVDARREFNLASVKSTLHFTDVGEDQALAFAVDAVAGGVVQTQHNVLRRND